MLDFHCQSSFVVFIKKRNESFVCANFTHASKPHKLHFNVNIIRSGKMIVSLCEGKGVSVEHMGNTLVRDYLEPP